MGKMLLFYNNLMNLYEFGILYAGSISLFILTFMYKILSIYRIYTFKYIENSLLSTLGFKFYYSVKKT